MACSRPQSTTRRAVLLGAGSDARLRLQSAARGRSHQRRWPRRRAPLLCRLLPLRRAHPDHYAVLPPLRRAGGLDRGATLGTRLALPLGTAAALLAALRAKVANAHGEPRRDQPATGKMLSRHLPLSTGTLPSAVALLSQGPLVRALSWSNICRDRLECGAARPSVDTQPSRFTAGWDRHKTAPG
jgi:hypothetical protein